MRVFLVSHAVSCVYFYGNEAKYIISRLFVILGQYFSADRVFAWVLRLVFEWITPQSCVRYGIITVPTLSPIPAPYSGRPHLRNILSRKGC